MKDSRANIEQDWLQRMAAGDETAFREVYQHYWKKLYAAAFKRLPDPDAVKDILQNIFLQLWQRKDALQITNLAAYLSTAVRNQVFKRFEREQRYEPLENLLLELQHASAQADALMLRKELLQSYYALLQTLTPAQRTIVQMRFEEDLSTDEIAQRLSISRKTVQNQLRMALLHIRSLLVLLIIIACREDWR